MYDYKSPIEVMTNQIQCDIDGQIMKATQAVGINIDKPELLKALQYDRDQYHKGYSDASSELVHCKDCKFWKYEDATELHGYCCNIEGLDANPNIDPNIDYCSRGVRE